jgi:hypothetical protein
MKKWEYMTADFIQGWLCRVNDENVDDFKYATNFRPVRGNTISKDFIRRMGENGWEAVQLDGSLNDGSIFFKRELEQEKKGD